MRGFEVAAEYVRRSSRRSDCKPLHGDWFQHFALRAATLDEAQSSLAINGKPSSSQRLSDASDFARENADVTRRWSLRIRLTRRNCIATTTAGIDARGKIVVILSARRNRFRPISARTTRRAT